MLPTFLHKYLVWGLCSLSVTSLQTAKLLSEMIIYLSMSMDNPWVIEPWHVRVGFRKAGIIVPEETLTMPPHPIAGPDLSIQGKEFAVTIKVS